MQLKKEKTQLPVELMPEPKWVKDALQWAKEAIDFTYDYVKVPDSLVETWGNMYMNTMHAIQEAQREFESPAAGREEIERRNKLIEDNLKLNCRLNMPGISQQEQECAWASYKLKHNL